MRISKLAALFAAALLLFPLSQAAAAEEMPSVSSKLLITELQTGGIDTAAQEFVELHNPEAAAVDLTGWQLQYLPATGVSWIVKATLSGTLEAGGYYIIATTEYPEPKLKVMNSGLSANGGHLRILPPGVTIATDIVGWGSAMHPDESPTKAPAPGMSSQRCMENTGYVDTDDNNIDFQEYTPTPGAGLTCNLDESEEPEAEEPKVSCQGVIFSEVLPNPAGADSNREFIELYNPTPNSINLQGCSLHIGSQSFVLGATDLPAGGYLVLYDSQTGITLPNTSGGSIYLLEQDTEIATATYPASLPDDAVWVWDGSQWQTSYEPTPGRANVVQKAKPCPAGQIRSLDSGRCRSPASTPTGSGLTPCKDGQTRNPETNRCRAVGGASTSLTPCKPGQERNPSTNRCKSVAASAVALTPCKAGQERNPATNRCRAVAATTTGLKPCATGQERNAETNRCRKIATAPVNHPVEVKEVVSTSKSPIGWWLAGLVGVGAASYAVYEWRHELVQKLPGIVKRHKRKS